MAENIHPIFDSILATDQKEKLVRQRSCVVWMVGLSGSGKSTLARALENSLHDKGFLTALLDGDNLRTGLNSNLGFSEEDRAENIRRAAEAAKLLAGNGIITICSLISPLEIIREMAKSIIGKKYVEVFIDCPLEVCEARDVKGLYAKARKGLIPNFTGIDSPFEAPKSADIVVRTAEQNLEGSLGELMNGILPIVSLNREGR